MRTLEEIRANVVVDENGCWIWQRRCSPNGYGDCWLGRRHLTAHRAAYILAAGEPEAGMDLDHLCRVRSCCNPDHLEVVERRVNARRGAKAKLSLDQIEHILASPESHRTLARKFGVTHQTIGYYKSGAYAPRQEVGQA